MGSIQSHYKRQRDIMCNAIKSYEYLRSHCEFVLSDGGMFIWLKFKDTTLPSFQIFKLLETRE